MVFVFVLVMAACSVANIVKSSLGPVGLDKMLVDDVGVRYLKLTNLFCLYTVSNTCLMSISCIFVFVCHFELRCNILSLL